MTITYLPMIGILYDTIILASTQKELKHSYIKEEVPKMLEMWPKVKRNEGAQNTDSGEGQFSPEQEKWLEIVDVLCSSRSHGVK